MNRKKRVKLSKIFYWLPYMVTTNYKYNVYNSNSYLPTIEVCCYSYEIIRCYVSIFLDFGPEGAGKSVYHSKNILNLKIKIFFIHIILHFINIYFFEEIFCTEDIFCWGFFVSVMFFQRCYNIYTENC